MISFNSATIPSSHVTPSKGRRAAILLIPLLCKKKNAMNYGLSLKRGTGKRRVGEWGMRNGYPLAPKFLILKILRFENSLFPFLVPHFPILRSSY